MYIDKVLLFQTRRLLDCLIWPNRRCSTTSAAVLQEKCVHSLLRQCINISDAIFVTTEVLFYSFFQELTRKLEIGLILCNIFPSCKEPTLSLVQRRQPCDRILLRPQIWHGSQMCK